MTRFANIITLSLLLLNYAANAETPDKANFGEMTVYRSPSCSCCGRWLEYVKKNKFKVKDIVTDEVQTIKIKYGVSLEMASCHTAIIDGYVLEGHVHAQDIVKLLTTKPAVTGLSVPGMPVGTPGMEIGDRKDTYSVLSFNRENQYQVFRTQH